MACTSLNAHERSTGIHEVGVTVWSLSSGIIASNILNASIKREQMLAVDKFVIRKLELIPVSWFIRRRFINCVVCVASNERLVMKLWRGRTENKAIVANFGIIYHNLSDEKKSAENSCQNSRSSSRDSSPIPLDYLLLDVYQFLRCYVGQPEQSNLINTNRCLICTIQFQFFLVKFSRKQILEKTSSSSSSSSSSIHLLVWAITKKKNIQPSKYFQIVVWNPWSAELSSVTRGLVSRAKDLKNIDI
jgi:hypothetical protein